MVCLSFGGSFHFRHMWLRQVTPVFQERQQAEGNRRWRRREEKRLSEQTRIRGGRLLKSCAPSPSSTSWPALYLFAKRSSRQRQDIFGALNYITVKTFQPKLKYCVLNDLLFLLWPAKGFTMKEPSPHIDPCFIFRFHSTLLDQAKQYLKLWNKSQQRTLVYNISPWF